MADSKKIDYAGNAVKNLQERQMSERAQTFGGGSTSAVPTMSTAPTTPIMQQPMQPPAVFGQGLQRQMAEPEREIVGVHSAEEQPKQRKQPIDSVKLEELNRELNKYRAGKKSVDQRTIEAERWWKMRNSFEIAKATDGERTSETTRAPAGGFQSATAWLHNVIASKHADALEAYPTPNILPREEGDKLEAWALSRIIPVVLKQNDFEATYDHAVWQKLKTGTAVYMVTWDQEKLNGLGDIAINRVDLLNIFWEPGINNIQDSKYVFNTALVDKDELLATYPDLLTDRMLQSTFIPSKMPADDARDTTDKVVVVDCYYKKHGVLHYIKYVGDTVLYATENDPERAERGMYDHGKYPFVFDTLFPIEGSPAGYGYVDICANPQTRIDLMNNAMLKNVLVGATPRYFSRADGTINEEEFLDLNNAIVHVNGPVDTDSLRVVDYKPLPNLHVSMLNSTIEELRETSGNTETSTGSSTNGVTAASALAALQEASGKTSRASTKASYRSFTEIVFFCIELIRQNYDLPRQFRITGNMGVQKYISFTNEGMQPQYQGMIGGVDMGFRKPEYDIEVSPEKTSTYTKIAQNELAIQLYSLGMFNPQMTDQALMCLQMMDFDGKDELMQHIAQNGTMWQQLQLYKAMAATLAAKHEPELVGGLLGAENQPQPEKQRVEKPDLDKSTDEPKNVSRAKARANAATQPGGAE